MQATGTTGNWHSRFRRMEWGRIALAAVTIASSSMLLAGAFLPSPIGSASRAFPLLQDEPPADAVAQPGTAGQATADLPPQPTDPAAAQLARAINARAPLVSAGLDPAPAFYFPGSIEDRLRAVDCLAAAAVYEAGGDANEQGAVIQVILNRLRHPAYPKTVCGVVFQGSERTTGCQFTFTCDGSMARRRPSERAWGQARRLASDALTGAVHARVGLATHYHTDWVAPVWSRQMHKIAVTAGHLFFRWRGGPGAPSAFSGRYAGGEPTMARLVALSGAKRPLSPPPAHMSAIVDVPALAGPAHDVSQAAEANRLPDRVRAPDDDTLLVLLQPGASPDRFVDSARRACGERAYCKYLGWTDAGSKAHQWPISGRAIDAISFSYVRASKGAPEQVRWNCQEFPRADAKECLLRGA